MLNISKYQAIVGCSAIFTAALAGFTPSAMAQVTNGSNQSGSNVTTFPAPAVPSTGGGTTVAPTFSPTTVSTANSFSERISIAQANADRAAAALAQAESAQPPATDSSPVRYGREAGDLASCGCPNADTVGTNNTNRPELVAARAAEAEAAAELAKAKAEARQFLETAKTEAASVSTKAPSPIW
jgi:hypothetical protein